MQQNLLKLGQLDRLPSFRIEQPPPLIEHFELLDNLDLVGLLAASQGLILVIVLFVHEV